MGRMKIHWTGLPRKESMRKLLIALAIVAGAVCWFWLTEDNSPSACQVPVVTAQSGDDMWKLAEQFCPDTDIRKVIHKMIKLNGGSEQIMPGQVILLPTK